jgi:hypothetical protein
LQYFDSLSDTRTGRRILGTLARWLLQDAADKGVELPISSLQQLSLQLAPPGMPQQVCVWEGGGGAVPGSSALVLCACHILHASTAKHAVLRGFASRANVMCWWLWS